MEYLKRRLPVLGLVGFVFLFASAQALAQGWGQGRGWGRGRGLGQGRDLGQSLAIPADLTAEQTKRIEALRTKFISQQANIQSQLDVKRAEKQQLMLAKKIDRRAVFAKDAEMEILRQQLRKARLAHRLDVLEILTPTQRASWMSRPGWTGRHSGWRVGPGRRGWGRGMRGCRGGGRGPAWGVGW